MAESSGSGDDEGTLHELDTYSGKLFWLNPPSGKGLDFEILRNELRGRRFQENISDEFDVEQVIIPDIFEHDGKIVRTTTMQDVDLASYDGEEVIVGDIVLDNIDRIFYRDSEVIIMDTTIAKFLVFSSAEFYYFAVLGRRELADSIVTILRNEFNEFGSLINNTRLGDSAISNIREALDATLMDTIITDYDQTEITQTRIQGRSYENTDVYDKLGREGKIKSHMFQTKDLVPDETKTVSIGRDGLVRIYSNATLNTYLKLLKKYVIPEVYRDVESSPSVGAWESVGDEGAATIFKDG